MVYLCHMQALVCGWCKDQRQVIARVKANVPHPLPAHVTQATMPALSASYDTTIACVHVGHVVRTVGLTDSRTFFTSVDKDKSYDLRFCVSESVSYACDT